MHCWECGGDNGGAGPVRPGFGSGFHAGTGHGCDPFGSTFKVAAYVGGSEEFFDPSSVDANVSHQRG